MELKDFEQGLGRLESIVAQLEKGELALEDALKLFEEGIRISQFCNSKLNEAERKVQILLKGEQGQWVETPFQISGDSKEFEE